MLGMEKYTINTDGGSRGNPGHAATGFVVKQNEKIIHEQGLYVGIKTNNEAEYQAVIHALDWVEKNIDKENPVLIEFRLDSNLVVNQLNGLYKIKQNHLQLLATQIHTQLKKLKAKAEFLHVYREFNAQADALVNKALDKHMRSLLN